MRVSSTENRFNRHAVGFSCLALPMLVVLHLLAVGYGFGSIEVSQSLQGKAFLASCIICIISLASLIYYTKRCDNLYAMVALVLLALVVIYSVILGPVVVFVSGFWTTG
jgi:uncharacterized membrane protein